MTLTALQSRLRDLAAGRPLLSGRPVLVEEKGNLVSDLEIALQTQALAVVVAPVSGANADNPPRGRGTWNESLEVVVHRGPLTDPDAPSTVAVIDDLREALHGAGVTDDGSVRGLFRTVRHDLRENGDGTYARVLVIAVEHSV